MKNKKLIILFLLIVLAAFLYFRFGNLIKKPLTSGKPVQIETPKLSPKAASLQQGPFKCPSSADFCATGSDINQGKYIGFGAKIASGSAIFASIDGDLTNLTSTLTNGEKMTVLYIDNKDRGLRASYFFQGNLSLDPKKVKSGDQIATVGGVLNSYNASLVFSITKNDPINGDKIKLTTRDFK